MGIGLGVTHPFAVLDRSQAVLSGDAMFPFALEDILCRHAGSSGKPVLHMWRHAKALILGLRDRRLPNAARAMAFFRDQGYSVIVRHSGGALVPLTQDVLNVSLILPKTPENTNFHQDFNKMVRLLRSALLQFNVQFDVGEIAGSYCPGDYDLSFGGRKFCGIAQRRQLHAFVIQAFVNVEGSGVEKGETAKRFYELASTDEPVSQAAARAQVTGLPPKRKIVMPAVQPAVMTTLSEIAGRDMCAQDVAAAVTQVVASQAGIDFTVNAGTMAAEDADWNRVFAAKIAWHEEATQLAAKLHERYS